MNNDYLHTSRYAWSHPNIVYFIPPTHPTFFAALMRTSKASFKTLKVLVLMFQMQKKCFRWLFCVWNTFFASETYFQCFETCFQSFKTCFQSSQRQKKWVGGSINYYLYRYMSNLSIYIRIHDTIRFAPHPRDLSGYKHTRILEK